MDQHVYGEHPSRLVDSYKHVCRARGSTIPGLIGDAHTEQPTSHLHPIYHPPTGCLVTLTVERSWLMADSDDSWDHVDPLVEAEPVVQPPERCNPRSGATLSIRV